MSQHTPSIPSDGNFHLSPVAPDITPQLDLRDQHSIEIHLTADKFSDESALEIAKIEQQVVSVGQTIQLLSGGQVTVTGPSTVTYETNGVFNELLCGQTALDTFQYSLSDTSGATASSEVVVLIDGESDIRICDDDFVKTTMNTPVAMNVSDQVIHSDPEVASMPNEPTVHLLNEPHEGEVLIGTEGTIIYIPEVDYTGTVTLHYLVEDRVGDLNDGTVTIEVEPPFEYQPGVHTARPKQQAELEPLVIHRRDPQAPRE